MKLNILASAPPKELLSLDAKKPENRIAEHPVWKAALEGKLPKPQLKNLLLGFYPALAGSARYAFAAKISQIDPADGKELFLQVHEALKNPAADADEGWKRVLLALGASEREIREALSQPSAEATDFADVIREHGLRTGAVEACVIAYMLEQHLPRLWGRLAESLQKHYGVKAAELAYLRYEAGRADKVEKWVKRLVEKYVAGAAPDRMYDARRAAREAVWAWTALTESIAT